MRHIAEDSGSHNLECSNNALDIQNVIPIGNNNKFQSHNVLSKDVQNSNICKEDSRNINNINWVRGRPECDSGTFPPPVNNKDSSYISVEAMIADNLYTHHGGVEVYDDMPDLDSDGFVSGDEEMVSDSDDEEEEVCTMVHNVHSYGSFTRTKVRRPEKEVSVSGDPSCQSPQTNSDTSYKSSNPPIIVNKAAQYKSEKNAVKYFIPKVDATDLYLYEDKRSTIEIFRDLLGIINENVDEATADLWSQLCQYDVRIKTVSAESGMSLLQEQMTALVKDFRKKQNLFSKADQKIIGDCEKEVKKLGNAKIILYR